MRPSLEAEHLRQRRLLMRIDQIDESLACLRQIGRARKRRIKHLEQRREALISELS